MFPLIAAAGKLEIKWVASKTTHNDRNERGTVTPLCSSQQTLKCGIDIISQRLCI